MVVFINTKLKSFISLFKKKTVSNLDEESKWTVHYTASWHQQENVFLPSTRPSCVEDLHKQAKVNLKTVLRECDKLRRDGCRSSQYYSQGPTFSSSPSMVCTSYQEDNSIHERKFSVSSNEEEQLLSNNRPKTPVSLEFSDTHTNWTKSLPLPTPEEKMRQEAQAIQTDVVPINVSAATGHIGFRCHSMHIPDNYNTLEQCHHSIQRLDTRDFSCQTEDVKIVPPSVRRIRAQKGQGIAALMSSSSGNMSTLSDPAGSPSRLNGDLHFRSLPRTAARVSLQYLEENRNDSRQIEDSFKTLPRQLNKLQVDDSVVHLRNNPRSFTLKRPKSQEVRGSENVVSSNPACVVSPHAAYSTSIIPNATLSSSSEVISIHTSQSTGQLDKKITSPNSSTLKKSVSRDHTVAVKDDHHTSGNWSKRNSVRQSHNPDIKSPVGKVPDGLHNMLCRDNTGYNNHSLDSDTRSESSYSDGQQRDGSVTSSINSADNWLYESRDNDSTPSRKLSSAVSGSPLSSRSTCSSERKADSSSLYSVDHDGFYTSMHVDSGISHHSQVNGNKNACYGVVSMFDTQEISKVDKSEYSDQSLPRSISLKKQKKPPQPPSRTDSLRRPPKNKAQTNGQVLNETLIATLQQSLQLNLKSKSTGSPSQSPCSDYEDPWILRSRSQSTASANSSGLSVIAPNMYSICAVTPSQSETSSLKSEYADHWSYFIDYAQTAEEHPKSPAKHTLNRPAELNGYNACEKTFGMGTSVPQVHNGLVKIRNSSPEKPCRVTSPSSGYSSQSNTPTMLTPVPLLSKTMSPVNGKNKIKPKVPERRSSLISSVSISSSSTSLSSNTSDSLQQSINISSVMLSPSHSLPTPPLTPDLPPPPVIDVVDSISPDFPPPPQEVIPQLLVNIRVCTPNSAMAAPIYAPPPPPYPIMDSLLPPPAPPLNSKVLKMGSELVSLRNSVKSNVLTNPLDKQELFRPTVPVVTAHALQMVQLRSVKKTAELETKNLAEQMPEHQRRDETSALFSRPSLDPSASTALKSTASINENMNCNILDEQVKFSSYQSNAEKQIVGETKADKTLTEFQASLHNGYCSIRSEMSPQGKPNISESIPFSESIPSPSKKPPPVSKKPKLFLIVPPPQLDLAAEKIAEVNENVRSMLNACERDSASKHCEEVNGHIAAENVGKSSSLAYQEETCSSPQKVDENTFFALPEEELQNNKEKEEQPSISDELNTSYSNTDSTKGSKNTFQGDDNVFEKEVASPSLWTSKCILESEEMTTPTRPVTTEDLFARIHRSKRKVLGRKESDDDRHINHSPSSPLTPTGGNTHLGSFKQTGAIQRSIRKTTTSSDNFKALLLKKGSRAEIGSRMSAAEMLKHTNPKFQRSKSDSSFEFPESPTLSSPNKNKKAQEEWAKNEGLMPRSMSVSGTRYSRSRTPPSAASSKYNVRSRLQSSPMTVICEGEIEAVDIVENSFSEVPLLSTKGLDIFHNSDSEINLSPNAQKADHKVHIDLSRLLEGNTEDDPGSVEEII
ncbi:hypothetical protein GDO86_009558 [Hymenochirus boettgeri]|uniref:NHS-like protein 1 n=1 Tax=Hymenochirus boettgeri TaxID=247094 RepID=A0A8T2JGW3_9PIPI|nr:hypothetical protein GDO86_009558 [Hymenochirus boettgeri]